MCSHMYSQEKARSQILITLPQLREKLLWNPSRDTVMQTAEALWIRENIDTDTAPAPATC